MRTLSLILPFAWLATAIAQQPSPTEPIDPKKLGAIEGQVTNGVTGEAQRRVNLTLRPMMMGIGSVGGGPIAPPTTYAAVTDAEGKFRIDRIDPGTYMLQTEKQGFVRQSYNSRQSLGSNTPLVVTAGMEMKEVNFKLTPHAIVTGRILDDEGEPLANIILQVFRSVRIRGKQQLTPVGGGQSSDTGEFRIANLAPGRYWLNASDRNRRMMMGETAVRNPNGKPEEEIVTTYYPSSIDEAGARPIELTAGQTLNAIDIRMKRAPVYRVRGKIEGPPPLRNYRVMLMPRERTQFMMNFGYNNGMVKDDGSFEIGSVTPGAYDIAATPSNGMMRILGRSPVDVARDHVENIVVTVIPAITLRGQIRVDGEFQGTLSNARIMLNTEGFMFNNPNAVADEKGAFTIENASPEKYRPMVNNLPQGLWLKSVQSGGTEVIDTGLDLSSGASGPIEIVLGVGTGTLTGTVTDSKQQPAPGIFVTLIPDPLREQRFDLLRTVPSNQTGQFTLNNIPPGEYKLYAWDTSDQSSVTDPEFIKPYETRAKRITIKPGGSEQVTLNAITINEK